MSEKGLQQHTLCRETHAVGLSIDSANLFAMALVIVKSVCAMMVSFGMFPLAKALCHAAGVRLPKGTSTFIFWGREESGGRGGNGVKCEVRGGVKSGRRGGEGGEGRDGWKGRG